MQRLLLTLLGLALVATGCANGADESGSGAQVDPTPTATVEATPEPTALEIPTSAPGATPTTEATAAPTATADPTATTAPTTAPTSTTAPQPTATTPPQPTATSVPQPTATRVPPAPTPTPTVYVDPDCYVGPGAADEPVWWCDGRICVAGNPHYGCPIGPPQRPAVRIDCTISDTDIEVDEIITLRAIKDPQHVPVQFAFSHGDGTIDNTAVSRAFYRAPGTYQVRLLWQYGGAKGSTPCGTVTVRPIGGATPTPTPTPATIQVGCSISPDRTVEVGEILTFTAFRHPSNVPVNFVFDHGDGTLDEGAVSKAYYASPGFYQVRLRWAAGNQSGTKLCGTVTVEPQFDAADYVGRARASAEALATSRGLTVRITRIDDQEFPVTLDYNPQRVNFEIDADVVTKATLG